MKIKTKRVSYEYVKGLKGVKHKKPRKPSFILQSLIRLLSIGDLSKTKFTYTKSGMERAGKGPYLILMNHSSFIDLKIASKIFYPMRYNIVSTTDSLVGKELLLRFIGCIPTQKFVADPTLFKDISYALTKNKTSVLMYPEAGYSFDGCSTALPKSLGKLIKKLQVPVLTVITDGAFLRDPLYNNLQLRKTKISAHLNCLLSKEEIAEKTAEEIYEMLVETFSFDAFKKQYETKTVINEPFRADGLNRILYRCPFCNAEGQMEGKGIELICKKCGKTHKMDELGRLAATEGETPFPHIPDWYNWQRECVKKELLDGTYKLDTEVEIGVIADYKALYMIGSGRLTHDETGFTLTGPDGLNYTHPPLTSYSLNSDYYWYEIGDVICIGFGKYLYYCFPKARDIVTKARLATEELYKIKKSEATNG